VVVWGGDPKYHIAWSLHSEQGSRGKKWLKDRLRISAIRTLSSEEIEFEEILRANEIEVGGVYSGTVLDLAKDNATLDVRGCTAIITKTDCSWKWSDTCGDVLTVGCSYSFLIKEVDHESGVLIAYRLFPEENPWDLCDIPNQGDVVSGVVCGVTGGNFVLDLPDGLQALMPYAEYSWFRENVPPYEDLEGQRIDVRVVKINSDACQLFVSHRQIDPDPWAEIHAAYPKGTELRGRVVSVDETGATLDIGEGMYGVVPASELRDAGYEYERFEETLAVGQGLDVVVSKVFVKKGRIRLALTRIYNKAQ
jgi:ribosomal protein S1